MNRARILLLCVVAVAATAAALRVRHETRRPQLAWRALAEPESKIALPPSPRDYVAEPAVDPEEAGLGPARIVSVAPSITEALCALGLADRIVGRTPYCLHPPAVQAVPTIGGLADPNLEKIRALAPDLILVTANSTRLQEQLGRLGLHTVPIPHDSFEDVFEAIRRIGALCDRPRTAKRLVEAIEADVARLERFVADRPARRPRTFVVLGRMPVPPQPIFVAGPGSFLDRLLDLAGGRNAAAEVLRVSHGELPLEQVRLLNPEVILEFRDRPTTRQRADVLSCWSEVGDLDALRRGDVRTVGGLEWLSAGPRVAIALHRFISALAACE